jgi:hypothetical protein
MNDKELLERAAKAAGIGIERSRLDDPMWNDFLLTVRDPRHAGKGVGWNPLTDDGDALRLAVTLRLSIWIGDNGATAESLGCLSGTEEDCADVSANDVVAAAARRAIVRQAASMTSNWRVGMASAA